MPGCGMGMSPLSCFGKYVSTHRGIIDSTQEVIEEVRGLEGQGLPCVNAMEECMNRVCMGVHVCGTIVILLLSRDTISANV